MDITVAYGRAHLCKSSSEQGTGARSSLSVFVDWRRRPNEHAEALAVLTQTPGVAREAFGALDISDCQAAVLLVFSDVKGRIEWRCHCHWFRIKSPAFQANIDCKLNYVVE